jgi:CheY-like chemotaxis protein
MRDLKKILHVEDELDIQEIAKMSLEGVGGFELMQCVSGEEALAAAPGYDPDLILLDVMMPGMDGEEIFKRLREFEGFENKPIIFMTAKAAKNNIQALIELGAADVITKPFDPILLPESVGEIWKRWHA